MGQFIQRKKNIYFWIFWFSLCSLTFCIAAYLENYPIWKGFILGVIANLLIVTIALSFRLYDIIKQK